MSGHTKGPFVVHGTASGDFLVWDSELDSVLARIPIPIHGIPHSTEEAKANAHLFAASADLLAACTEFVRLSDAMATEWQQGDWRAVLTCVRQQTERFRAAIARAEGSKS
jgi:hypothetical protein